jgi:MoaA/NifB/PqqE/SkfB family radical SAM enzyme
MYLNPDGRQTLCCVSHHQVQDEKCQSLNAQTHSLAQIWNSPGMKDVRRRMAEGEQLPHCRNCFNDEAFGRVSQRNRSNEHWLGRPEGHMLARRIEESTDGTAPFDPMYLDLRLGNLCNLKCTACKPLYSSQIERDEIHSKWNAETPYTRLESRFGPEGEWYDADQLLGEMVGISGNLAKIQLAGGEPTINKTQIAFLKHLCDAGRAPDIDLVVVTNLSNVRQDVYDLFARFKSLCVVVSIDGTHEVYEYVRYPAKWSSILNNLARLRRARPDVHVQIDLVLQAINSLNIVDVFDWADSEDISVGILIGRGLDEYNDFRIMPATVRDELRRRFEQYFARKDNRRRGATWEQLVSIFAEMDADDFSDEVRRERIRSFMHFINDMDASRGLSFRRVAPDVYNAVVAYAGFWDGSRRHA